MTDLLHRLNEQGAPDIARRLNVLDERSLIDRLNEQEPTTVTGEIGEFFKGIAPGVVRLAGTSVEGFARQEQTIDVAISRETRRLFNRAQQARVMSDDEFETFKTEVRAKIPPGGISIAAGIDDELINIAERIRSGELSVNEAITASPLISRIIEPPKFKDQPLFDVSEQIKGVSERLLPAAPGYETSIGRQLGEGFGSLIAGALAQLATGPAGAALLFTTAGVGEASERARLGGASEEQQQTAAVMGMVPGMTDILPVEVLLRRVPRASRGKFVAYLKRVFQMMVVEGGQEGAQEAMQNWIEREVYNPAQTLFEQVPQAGALGAGVGGIAETFFSFLGLFGFRRRGRRGRRGPPSPPPGGPTAAPAAEAAPTPTPQPPAEPTVAPEPTTPVRVTFPSGETATGELISGFDIDGEEGVRIIFEDGLVYDGPAADIEIEPIVAAEPTAPAVPPVPPRPTAGGPVLDVGTVEDIEASPLPTELIAAGQAAIDAPPAAREAPTAPLAPTTAPVAPEPEPEAVESATQRRLRIKREKAKARRQAKKQEIAEFGPPPPKAPPNILEFLAEEGGIKDEGGELNVMDAHLWHHGRAFQKKLVREDGRSPDAAQELAEEAGYLQPGSTLVDFYAAIDKNLRGEPVFAAADLTEVAELQEAETAENELARYEGMTDDQIATELGLDPVRGAQIVEDSVEDIERAAIQAENDYTDEVDPDGANIPFEPTERIAPEVGTERAREAEPTAERPPGVPVRREEGEVGAPVVEVAPPVAPEPALLPEAVTPEPAEPPARRQAQQPDSFIGGIFDTEAQKQADLVELAQKEPVEVPPEPAPEPADAPIKPPASFSQARRAGWSLKKISQSTTGDARNVRIEITDPSGHVYFTITSFPKDDPLSTTEINETAYNAIQRMYLQRVKEAQETVGGTTLTAGFDPLEALRSIPRLAAMVREDAKAFKDKLRGSTAVSGRITVEEPLSSRDLNVLRHVFMTPLWATKHEPEINRLMAQGMEADYNQSRFISRTLRDYDSIRKPLNEDEFSQLGDLLLVGDSEGVEYTNTELRTQGLGDKVVTAYAQTRKYFDKLARFVDQHERAMRPQYRKRKASLLKQMSRLRDMSNLEFRKLYGQRSRLRAQLRIGDGAPEALAARIAEIDVDLHGIREQSPEYQGMLAEIDQIDAKLARTSIRRLVGHFPHKFFGTWRLFKLTERTNEEGETEPYWEHIAGEHGFFPSRIDAVKAANAHAKANPDDELRVAPVQFKFPNSDATQLSDPAYWRFVGRVGEQLGVEGDELRDVISGVARRRFRRRIAGFSLFRAGVPGYSKNVDRVIVAHTGEVIRYVMMDKLKYDAINTMEKMGLSPQQSFTDRPELARFVQLWLRDVMGQKQPLEQSLDNLMNTDSAWARPVNAALATGTMAFGAAGGLSGNPFVGLAVGSYVGYRVFRARQQSPEFTTRALTGAMLGDMAHLKLGAIFNVMSPVVNLSQTILNTYPILGAEYTSKGIMKLWAAKTSDLDGKPNSDWKLLQREDIATKFKFTEQSPNLFARESRAAFWSLYLFNTAEQINRATAFLGAFHQAIDGGASQAKAIEQGRGIKPGTKGVIRTQFLYSNANKPLILRGMIRRVPLQFKNFLIQEIGFAFSLRGAEIPRFLLSAFFLAGALGIPGAGIIDWLYQLLFDESPMEEAKKQALFAQAKGELEGTAAQVLLRGLPALVGTDVSARIGLGDKFLPTQLRDFKGPWWSTIEKSAYLGEKNATIVDQLRNLSTGIGAPLKALEAAGNGLPLFETLATEPRRFMEALGDGEARLTSPWKNGNLEYRPTTTELVIKAIGGTPIREAQLRDVSEITQRSERQAREDTREYLNQIVRLFSIEAPATREQKLREIIEEAANDGVQLSRQQIIRAIKDAGRTRAERLIRGARKPLRPEIIEMLRGIGGNEALGP